MRILLSVDGSDTAERAFDWYVDHIHKPENEVVVMHVSEQPKLPTFTFAEVGAFPSEEISRIMVENNKKLADLENAYTMKCSTKKLKNKIVMRPSEGEKPGEVVVKYCKDNGINMIVMGSRGLGTVRRTFLGSVSDFVVHHAKIPVLIIPKA